MSIAAKAAPLACWVLFLGMSAHALADDRRLTFDWIMRFERPVFVEISPDGGSLLYGTTRPTADDVTAYGAVLTLYRHDLRTGQAQRVTELGDGRADYAAVDAGRRPRWHPDGRRLLYLREANGTREIWISNLDGRGARQLSGVKLPTTLALDRTAVEEYSVSPDGTLIAIVRSVQRPSPAADGTRGEQRRAEALSENPEFFDGDRIGRRRAVVTLLNVESGEEVVLKDGPSTVARVRTLSWAPGGEKLLMTPPYPGWTREAKAASLSPSIIDLRTRREAAAVSTPNHIDQSAVWSPDGSRIASVVATNIVGHQVGSHVYSVWTARVGTDGAEKDLRADELFLRGDPPFWNPFDGQIYLPFHDRTTVRLTRVSSAGARSRELVTPPGFTVHAQSFSRDGAHVAVVMSNRTTPPEVYYGHVNDRTIEPVTNFRAHFAGKALGGIDLISWPSADGRFETEGFLLKPAQYNQSRRYPLLLHMHGGPGATYVDEFNRLNVASYPYGPLQLLAQEGYLILMPNPRGDRGYSVEHHLALIGNIGKDVALDCMAGVDFLVKAGIADPGRLGVLGASYGAISTLRAIGETTRFKAASADDGAYNWIRHRLTVAMPFDYESVNWMEYYTGGRIHEVGQRYWDASPISRARHIRTPTLMRMSYMTADDVPTRATLADNLDIYDVLRANDVPADIVAYPGMGHVITGLEQARDWLNRNIAWFNYWLLDKPYPNAALQQRFDAYKASMKKEGIWK